MKQQNTKDGGHFLKIGKDEDFVGGRGRYNGTQK